MHQIVHKDVCDGVIRKLNIAVVGFLDNLCLIRALNIIINVKKDSAFEVYGLLLLRFFTLIAHLCISDVSSI